MYIIIKQKIKTGYYFKIQEIKSCTNALFDKKEKDRAVVILIHFNIELIHEFFESIKITVFVESVNYLYVYF